MVPPTSLSTTLLAKWAHAATAKLSQAREEINALNVFPVPDKDTGSNMVATLQAAVAQLNDDAPGSLHEVAASLAAGAVRGARGNSGAVISQIFRALAEQTAGNPEAVPAVVVARILTQAAQLARQAIAQPQPGTVLTVLQAAATAAEEAAAHAKRYDVLAVVGAANQAAVKALAATTGQLPALAKAGVVDAGGQGICLMLAALEEVLRDPESLINPKTVTSAPVPQVELPLQEVMWRQEVAEPEVLTAIQAELERLGDSVVIARETAACATCHVHTRNPAAVLNFALASGKISNLHFEALPDVRRGKRQVLAIADPLLGELLASFDQAIKPLPNLAALPQALGAAALAGCTEVLVVAPFDAVAASAAELEQLAGELNLKFAFVPVASPVQLIIALAGFEPELPFATAAATMMDLSQAVTVTALAAAEEPTPALITELAQAEHITVLAGPDVQIPGWLERYYPAVFASHEPGLLIGCER